MELRQLKYFLVCADQGSLTKAAEELFTTQPHVSQVIRSLERELGVSLFRRTGTGVALTEDGERIRLLARNAVKSADLIQDTAEDVRGETLRIAVNPSSRLAVLAGEYFCDHRDSCMTMEYTECSIEQMLELLQNHRYDLGLLFLPENKRTAFSFLAERKHLRYIPLLNSDLVLHCGPGSRFFGRESIQPEELDGCTCIQLEDDYFSVDELLAEHGGFRSRKLAIRKAIRTNSDHLMLEMLRNTDLCNLGSYWLRGTEGETAFTRAVVEGFRGQVSFGCLCIDNRPLSPLSESFLARLKERMEKNALAIPPAGA